MARVLERYFCRGMGLFWRLQYADGEGKAHGCETLLLRFYPLVLVYICASQRKDGYSNPLLSPVALSYGRRCYSSCHTSLLHVLLSSGRIETTPVVQSLSEFTILVSSLPYWDLPENIAARGVL